MPRVRLVSTLLALGVLCCGALLADPFARAVNSDLSLDDEFARIAEEVPGFGGMFYDDAGVANVYLTDASRAADLRRLGADGFKVLPGQYDYRDLVAWRADVDELLSLPNVVWTDIDERRNRIAVGIDQEAGVKGIQAIESELARTRAPRPAVIVESVPAIYNQVTLRDRIRPVPAGVQIAFGGFVCTLGVNVTRAGVAGFVTNSHCSGTQGGVQNTVFFQNTNTAANRIGIEVADPTYGAIAGCPAGRVCRRSDSSFARYDAAALREQARIAHITACAATAGTITIDAATTRYTITGTANPVVGQVVRKTGRTTGCTRNSIQQTNVNVNVSGTNITQLGQAIVGAASGGGDSGSPVFAATSNTTAVIYGVMWGGDAAGTLFVFSPWSNITGELGAMTVN